MSTSLNHAGLAKAHALVAAGKVNDGAWSFSADDGDKLLGDSGDDWENYSQWFMAIHPDQTEKSKAYYGYPFGKNGEVYVGALRAIASRASQQDAEDISKAASALIETINGKNGKSAPIPEQRAYSTFSLEKDGLKEDDNFYYINGIASTPSPDRVGDIVVPTGAKFALPLPLLWQHDSYSPIGNVTAAKATKNGIPITAQIPKVKEAGTLKDRIDEAIQSIKYGLVTGLSIGFRALRDGWEFLEDGGIQFNEWEWMELSAVTIPANAEATISMIKTIDRRQLANAGNKTVALPKGIVRLSPTARASQKKAGVVQLTQK